MTICTHDHHCLFGEVAGGKMQLNRFGKIAWREWQRTESLRKRVVLDAFIIMPNHMHAILGIMSMPGNQQDIDSETVGAYGHTPLRNVAPASSSEDKRPFRSPSKTVGAIVRGYKSAVTTQINQMHNTPGETVWQRN